MAIRVKATRMGYYNHLRRKPDQIFTIQSEKEFSALWMEKDEDQDGVEPEPKVDPSPGKRRGRPPGVKAESTDSVI